MPFQTINNQNVDWYTFMMAVGVFIAKVYCFDFFQTNSEAELATTGTSQQVGDTATAPPAAKRRKALDYSPFGRNCCLNTLEIPRDVHTVDLPNAEFLSNIYDLAFKGKKFGVIQPNK